MAVEVVEGVAVSNVESAQPEVTTAAVHCEDPMAPLDTPSGESIMQMTPEVTTETDPIENPSAVDAGSTPHQEYPPARSEGSIPAKGTEIVSEGTPVVLVQTTNGFDPYRGQEEEPSDAQETGNVPPTPEVGGSEHKESAGGKNKDEGLPSVGGIEGQDSDQLGGDAHTETGTPQEESVHESTRDSSSGEEAGGDQSPRREPTEGGCGDQGQTEWTMAVVKGTISIKSPMTLMQRMRMRGMSLIMERDRKKEQHLLCLD